MHIEEAREISGGWMFDGVLRGQQGKKTGFGNRTIGKNCVPLDDAGAARDRAAVATTQQHRQAAARAGKIVHTASKPGLTESTASPL